MRRRLRTIMVHGLAAFAVAGAASACAAGRLSIGCEARQFEVPEYGEPLTVRAERAGWIEVHERGLDVDVEPPAGSDAYPIATPLRYGWTWLDVRRGGVFVVRRTEVGTAVGDVAVRLHCGGDPVLDAEREWVRSASPVAVELLDLKATAPPAIDAALDARLAAAPTARTRAFGRHLIAQRALLAAQTTLSSERFAAAEAAWLRAADLPRAYAARVARVEEFNRRAMYDDVLRLARSLPDAPDPGHYYGIRLESARCLALQYLARLDDAVACHRWVLDAYARRGEVIEHAAIAVDSAYVQRMRGDRVAAAALAGQAIARVMGPEAPLIRGRARLLLSDLALDRGDLVDALQQVGRADAEFAAARASRWQANAMLKTADIWSAVGASSDALAAVTAALALLGEHDAPARRAAALMLRARIARDLGDRVGAAADASAAMQAYAALAMPFEQARAAAFACHVKRGNGRSCVLGGSVDPVRDALVAAERALASDDPRAARDRLEGLHADDVELRAELARLRVAAALALGDAERARATAHAEAHAWQDIAYGVGNPVLAALLRQRADTAVALGLQAALPALRPQPSELAPGEVAEIGRWLSYALPAPPAGDRTRVAAAARKLDAARTPGRQEAGSIATRLALLAAAAAHGHAAPRAFDVLAALRAQLLHTSEDALLAVLPAGDRLVVLVLTRDTAVAWHVDPADVALADRDPAPVALARRADRLARAFVQPYADARRIRRWWILERGPATAIPWSMLPDADGVRLGERAAVARVEPSTVDAVRSDVVDDVVVLRANPQSNALAPLPALAQETETLAQFGARIVAGARRDDVLAALDRPLRVVQLSMHGDGLGERLGGSGLWLGSDRAEYLSGLELLARGVRARTVVLGACAVAATGTATDLSLARSLVLAGADDVVAPLWAVGDEASATFTLAFHAALRRDPAADVASAVHAAQASLRATRAWRSPVDWAAWTHLRRVAVVAREDAAPD